MLWYYKDRILGLQFLVSSMYLTHCKGKQASWLVVSVPLPHSHLLKCPIPWSSNKGYPLEIDRYGFFGPILVYQPFIDL